jgi:hypothetical protein
MNAIETRECGALANNIHAYHTRLGICIHSNTLQTLDPSASRPPYLSSRAETRPLSVADNLNIYIYIGGCRCWPTPTLICTPLKTITPFSHVRRSPLPCALSLSTSLAAFPVFFILSNKQPRTAHANDGFVSRNTATAEIRTQFETGATPSRTCHSLSYSLSSCLVTGDGCTCVASPMASSSASSSGRRCQYKRDDTWSPRGTMACYRFQTLLLQKVVFAL